MTTPFCMQDAPRNNKKTILIFNLNDIVAWQPKAASFSLVASLKNVLLF